MSLSSTPPKRNILWVALLYIAAFLLILYKHPGSHRTFVALDDGFELAAPFFAGACGLSHVQRGWHRMGRERAGWLLVALGCVSWSVGETIWAYYEVVAHIDTPFPSWADAGYLFASALILGGVLQLFSVSHVAGRARLVLDSAITTSGVAMLSWYFVIERLWHQSGVSLMAKWIGIAYPLGDVAALFAALVLLGTSSGRRRLVAALLAGGLVLEGMADSLFNFYTLNQTYQTGMWIDAGWVFGWMLFGSAFLVLSWAPDEADASVQADLQASAFAGNIWGIMAPYAAVMTAFSFVAYCDYQADHRIQATTLAQGLGLLLLVVFRQVLTLVENRQLTCRLRVFNETLEAQVNWRTEQLDALLRLTRAVNGSLDVSQVLAEAVTQIRQALRADGVLLCLGAREGQTKDVTYQEGLDDAATRQFLSSLPTSEHGEMLALPIGGTSARSCLRAPLLWQRHRVGMVSVVGRPEEFGAGEIALIESIGLTVGTALENARQYQAAREAADQDPVTGLLNHRSVQQRLDAALAQARCQEQPLALIMMDLDDFGLFNDTYGHPVGDQVLRKVALALEEARGPQGILGRYGGDEFLLALPGVDAAGAQARAQRVRDGMARTGFRAVGDERTVPLSLSFGIAVFPADSDCRHDLLTLADANLYTAKRQDESIVVTTAAQRSHRALRAEGSFSLLDAMVTSVDNKDSYTRRHCEDVTEYSLWIAEALGLSEETQRTVRIGGLLHDIGKIGIPDEILRKPGRLTATEYEVMQGHPVLGALIVSGVPGMGSIVDAVRSHHERWDGQGYPDALAGMEIPLLGRILAVADAFSAMTTDRPYRHGMQWEDAMEEIRRHSGTQFDPALAEAFLHAADRHHVASLRSLAA